MVIGLFLVDEISLESDEPVTVHHWAGSQMRSQECFSFHQREEEFNWDQFETAGIWRKKESLGADFGGVHFVFVEDFGAFVCVEQKPVFEVVEVSSLLW